MTDFTRDPDFLSAIQEIFGEAAEKMLAKPDVVLQLERIWLRSMWRERERIYNYLSRDEVRKAFDQGGLTSQLRIIVGNGTYLDEEPSLVVYPPWLGVSTRISLEPVGVKGWGILLNGEKLVARVSRKGFVGGKDLYVAELLEEDEVVASHDFWTLPSAIQHIEEAAKLMAKAMGVPIYTRQITARKWAVEDMEMSSLGQIQKVNSDGRDFYVAVFESDGDGPHQQFPTFDEAVQWLRFRSSEVQNGEEKSKRIA